MERGNIAEWVAIGCTTLALLFAGAHYVGNLQEQISLSGNEIVHLQADVKNIKEDVDLLSQVTADNQQQLAVVSEGQANTNILLEKTNNTLTRLDNTMREVNRTLAANQVEIKNLKEQR